jgi:isoleucyl-tRNA synthetase
VIAPILTFTAEEIYEAMPGEKERSVHLTEFPTFDVTLAEADEGRWNRLLRLREAVNKVLERARAAKEIGKSLEADIVLSGAIDVADIDLTKLFIVSHVDIQQSDDAATDHAEIDGIGRVGIRWTRARGQKCGRCWLYREEVSSEGGLCQRCQTVVDGMAVIEMPTA